MPEETLYVTNTSRIGQFFGQFERRSTEDLKAMELELAAVYDNLHLKPCLYADGKEHLGDNGVIQWSEDQQFYRVEIVQELPDNLVT